MIVQKCKISHTMEADAQSDRSTSIDAGTPVIDVVGAGVYFYRFRTGEEEESGRLTLIK